jgi:hypothetical protein
MIDPAKDNKKGAGALWPQASEAKATEDRAKLGRRLRAKLNEEECSSNEVLSSDEGL